jgi:ParB-like chromosome segregation protein Spo0J
MKRELTTTDPKKLLNHPLNAWLYGTDPEAEFVESVRRHGVIEPIVVSQSLTIISGHRRRQAAIVCGLGVVPISIYPKALDDLEIRRLLIEFNRQRPKTVEQRAREYQELEAVEKELAKRRQATSTGGANPASSEVGEAEKGRAKRRAAAQVGMSEPTADKAAAVVQEIDAAEAAGDPAKAADLRHKLEHESVSAAHRAAYGQKAETATEPLPETDAAGNPVPRRLADVFALRTRFEASLSLLRQVKADMKKLAELPGGREIRFNELTIDLDNARRHIRFAMPHGLCPYCKANGEPCEACKKSGWVTETVLAQAPKNEAAAAPAAPITPPEGGTL